MHRQLDDIIEALAVYRTQTQRNYQTLNTNIRRIAMAPVCCIGANEGVAEKRPVGAAVGAANAIGGVATLSSTPRTIHLLWQEYTDGIGGRKAARLFTPQERGANKHKFTRRKVVWDTVARLVRGGMTANVACDRIYKHYGRQVSVTRIINAMLQDRRNGTIPAALQY